MIPFFDSVTIAQAAVIAAFGEVLLVLYYLVTLVPGLSASTPVSNLAPVVLGAIVPSLVWAGFFFVVYCERIGVFGTLSFRVATWITLFVGIGLQIVFVLIPFETATIFLTPLGLIRRIDSWLLRLGWVVFLVLFARIPDHPWTRKIALLLAILSAPSGLSTAYSAFNNGIGFLFDDMPRQALWRALITPVTQTAYWVSQILFLWTVWGNPERQNSVKPSSLHFTP